MKLDLSKYSINKPFIIAQYKRSITKNVQEIVSVTAATTHCPCAALAFYMSEHVGFTPEVMGIIEALTEFYGYEEVLNQPENSPYNTDMTRRDIRD
jgi:hypothetical protein